MQPKKFSEYTPITETDGSEVIPILKAGVNATVKSEDLPISTATQTAIDAADADIAAHVADVANPHQVTKTQVGLGNADNTSDANKPVSTAQATAIALKADTTYVDSQDALKADQATTYTKTEVDTRDTAVADTAQANLTAHTSNTGNPHATTKSQVGLANADNTSDVDKPISAATQTALDAKASTTALDAHANSTANPHNVTKAQVGLGDADNTSDANKPVSTATQTALNAKANASDTVNLTGNQTLAGVKTFSSSPVVPTATTSTQAVNKAQMDTADALKVNKAGDTMTGALNIAKDTGNLRLSNVTYPGSYAEISGTRYWLRMETLGEMNGVLYPGNLRVEGTTQLATFRPLNDLGSDVGQVTQRFGIGYINEVRTNKLVIGGGPQYLTGTGFPNGVVTAPVGSIYIDTAITNGASSWIKKSGTGNTGWEVLEGDTGWRDISSLLVNGWTATKVQLKRSTSGGVMIRAFGVNGISATSTLFVNPLPDGFRISSIPEAYTISEEGTNATYFGLVGTSGQVYAGITRGVAKSLYLKTMFETANAWPSVLPGVAA